MIAIIYKGLHTHIVFGKRINKTHFVPLFGTVRQFNHYQVRCLNSKIEKIEDNNIVVNLGTDKLFETIYRQLIQITNAEKEFLNCLSNISNHKTRFTKTNARKFDSFLSIKYIGIEGLTTKVYQFVDYNSNTNIIVYSDITDTECYSTSQYYIKKNLKIEGELLNSTYIVDLTNHSSRAQINSLVPLLNFKNKKVIEDFVYNMTSILLNTYNPVIFTY